MLHVITAEIEIQVSAENLDHCAFSCPFLHTRQDRRYESPRVRCDLFHQTLENDHVRKILNLRCEKCKES